MRPCALHAGAGPVMRLVLAGEGSTDPAVLAEAGTATAALASGGEGEAFGAVHLNDVCAAHGLVPHEAD